MVEKKKVEKSARYADVKTVATRYSGPCRFVGLEDSQTKPRKKGHQYRRIDEELNCFPYDERTMKKSRRNVIYATHI